MYACVRLVAAGGRKRPVHCAQCAVGEAAEAREPAGYEEALCARDARHFLQFLKSDDLDLELDL